LWSHKKENKANKQLKNWQNNAKNNNIRMAKPFISQKILSSKMSES